MSWESDKYRGTRQERGYGAKWQKIRQWVLKRDKHLCQICINNNHITPANEVDHIIPKANGGTDDINNLQSLCAECHKMKTARDNGALPKGCDESGAPTDPYHPWNCST